MIWYNSPVCRFAGIYRCNKQVNELEDYKAFLQMTPGEDEDTLKANLNHHLITAMKKDFPIAYEPYDLLGDMHMHAGKYKAAAEQYQVAVGRNSRYCPGLNKLSDCYDMLGYAYAYHALTTRFRAARLGCTAFRGSYNLPKTARMRSSLQFFVR